MTLVEEGRVGEGDVMEERSLESTYRGLPLGTVVNSCNEDRSNSDTMTKAVQ